MNELKNSRSTIDELLANMGPECEFKEPFEVEKDYDEVVESFKRPETIVIDLSAFETENASRVRQMWDVIRLALENANMDWKSKEVALNFEYVESSKLGFGEMFDILNWIDDQVQKLYWTMGISENTSINITYDKAEE